MSLCPVPLKNLKALCYQHKIKAEEFFNPKQKFGFLQCFTKKHNEVIQKLVRPFNLFERPLQLEELMDVATEVVDIAYQKDLMEPSNLPPYDLDRPISPGYSQEDPRPLGAKHPPSTSKCI